MWLLIADFWVCARVLMPWVLTQRSVQGPDPRRSIGFDVNELQYYRDADNVPPVRWMRVEFASATLESAPPAQILDSYEAWQDWAASTQPVRCTVCCSFVVQCAVSPHSSWFCLNQCAAYAAPMDQAPAMAALAVHESAAQRKHLPRLRSLSLPASTAPVPKILGSSLAHAGLCCRLEATMLWWRPTCGCKP